MFEDMWMRETRRRAGLLGEEREIKIWRRGKYRCEGEGDADME